MTIASKELRAEGGGVEQDWLTTDRVKGRCLRSYADFGKSDEL